ncbi:MAG: rod shape-determining protein MreC [candidate division Zixibacteria bacterium]|nr:rod shape-determining protein MreC [candidate division Zixibacteria bacterium]
MAWFPTVSHKNRRLFKFSLIAILFLLVAFPGSTVGPFLGNLSATIFYSPFFKFRNYIESLQNVAVENSRLRNQLAQMSLQLNSLVEARRENQRLRKFIGFDAPPSFRLAPVKIVSVMQHFYPLSAIINKGKYDGIKANQTIVSPFGLVGKIKEVMPHTATVQLLTDPGNAISVRVADSRQIGIVKFSLENGMILDNLPADANVAKGDLIISSGLGGIYPSGLPVARVDSVYANQGEIFKLVKLRPAVNFFEIDELYVLVNEL